MDYNLTGNTVTSLITNEPYYKIQVNNESNFTSKLTISRQGYLIQNKITLQIPNININRYNQFTTLFENNWVAILIDNNNNNWAFGLTTGLQLNIYQSNYEDNLYEMSLETFDNDLIYSATNDVLYNIEN